MALISPAIDISVISVILVVVSRFLQNKLVDKKGQKAAQQRMKEKQKKIKDLVKNTDEKSKKEVQRLQQELFTEMGETMQGSMRYMMFSFPVFIGAFILLGMFYGSITFEAPFTVPKFENFFLLNPFTWMPVGWGYSTGWLKWYFISYLITSIILAAGLKIAGKAMEKNKAM